ncbi:MAG: transposase, partial [Chloroflexota bacterium]
IPSNAIWVQEERQEQQQIRMRIVAKQLPEPSGRNFYLFGLDTTGQPRPFAKAIADRAIHYHPNPAPGNKPIIAGHSYSVLAALPEKTQKSSPPWVLPLLIQRVATDKKAIEVGVGQVADILKDEQLPFGKRLCALVTDSSYGVCEFVGHTVEHKNLITIARVRGNRTFYRIAEGDVSNGKGHPTWYGTAFDMKDSTTWGEADATETVSFTLRNGRVCQVRIEAWYNLLMSGKRGIPMHTHPFTLIRITVEDSDGKLVFKRPLWLIVIGERRREISLSDAYYAYRQRYDLEHFFRFGKQKLLMSSYQTPDVEHEQNWWEIAGLAYTLLYVSAPLAQNLPRPWERYLPEFKTPKPERLSSPSMVQRDLPRIIRQIGTPAPLPKPRGKSSGRIKGYSPGKRAYFPLIIKGTKSAPKYLRAP